MEAMEEPAAKPTTTHPARRRWLVAVAAPSLLAATFAVGWLVLASNNLHEVVAGSVLRSAQPSAADLARLVRERGLHTVINLRADGQHDWLQREEAACAGLGIDLYSIGFSTTEWPRQYRVRELVRLLDVAKRPLLLHCRRGTDRAGWASALVRMLDGDPPEQALSELDLWHGHICDRATCPLHRFFASYEVYLEHSGQVHSGAAFRRWVLEVYCPEPYDAELALAGSPPSVVAVGAPLHLAVDVRNRGGDPWRMAAAEGGVRLGVRALGPLVAPPAEAITAFRTGDHPVLDLGRADVGAGVLPPGGRQHFEVSFAAPAQPGLYILQVDMVEELVHWFSDMGGPGLLLELRVTPRPERGTDDHDPEIIVASCADREEALCDRWSVC